MSGFQTEMSRRQLLTMIGTAAGSAAMYNAMTSLGFAQESPYSGPINLEGDPNGVGPGSGRRACRHDGGA